MSQHLLLAYPISPFTLQQIRVNEVCLKSAWKLNNEQCFPKHVHSKCFSSITICIVLQLYGIDFRVRDIIFALEEELTIVFIGRTLILNVSDYKSFPVEREMILLKATDRQNAYAHLPIDLDR
jgi:hypothetical protein